MKKIERLKAYDPGHGHFDLQSHCTVLRSDLDRLEAENQEMLEALIAYRNDISAEAEEETGIYIDDIIKKVSGKTWEQIKDSER